MVGGLEYVQGLGPDQDRQEQAQDRLPLCPGCE